MSEATHHIIDRIVRDPAIMVGKSVVRGTRIPVERVLAHLADNPDVSDLNAAFPRLTHEDVRACLEYPRFAAEEASSRPVPDDVPASAR